MGHAHSSIVNLHWWTASTWTGTKEKVRWLDSKRLPETSWRNTNWVLNSRVVTSFSPQKVRFHEPNYLPNYTFLAQVSEIPRTVLVLLDQLRIDSCRRIERFLLRGMMLKPRSTGLIVGNCMFLNSIQEQRSTFRYTDSNPKIRYQIQNACIAFCRCRWR